MILSIYSAKMLEIDVAYEIREVVKYGTTICPHAGETLRGSRLDSKGGQSMELWRKWRMGGGGGSAGRNRRVGDE